ncbi:MAG: 1-acyl-sn-glycerol-3-phosphate acyltransferase [Bacteroidales bacterium]|nr:1-acyl-sn-glycerol-3-phosphate acyltransferase [Bacteroidales bacterium]
MMDWSEYGPAYEGFKTREGVYVPEPFLDFPGDDPSRKVAPVKPFVKKIDFDGTYPYLDDSFNYKLNSFICYTGLWSLAFLLNRIRYGLRIEGRSRLRRYRRLFKDGAMTVCNHVYRWDMICVLQAIRFRRSWIPMFAPHFLGADSWFMRYIGGIPVPEDRAGLRRFNEAFDELHRRKAWMHVFPESSSWKFYAPVRPFHIGAFNMAYKYDLPVIPCVISFRERTGLYKLFGSGEPLVTIHVGTPVVPDRSRSRKEEAERLRDESHAQMVEMAGIIANPWPASSDALK